MDCTTSNKKILSYPDKKIHEWVEKRANELIKEGHSSDYSYITAMEEINAIDYDEYNNMVKASKEKGTWY
jgi:hypothetical protein